MKTILGTCLFAALAMQAGQAATIITVTDADLDPDVGQNGTPSEGTLSVTTNISDGAAPQNLVYTISGLTIDGAGVGDDSVDITFTASTDGQDLNSGVDNSSQGWLSAGGVRLNADGEFVQLAFSSMSVNVSGGTDNGFGSFLGFTELTVNEFADAGDEVLVNDVLKTFTGADTSPFAIANEDFVKLEFEATAGDTVGFRMHTWDFQFSAAIPEPSRIALLGLGGFALLLRRRR